jgi:hypothetical protein
LSSTHVRIGLEKHFRRKIKRLANHPLPELPLFVVQNRIEPLIELLPHIPQAVADALIASLELGTQTTHLGVPLGIEFIQSLALLWRQVQLLLNPWVIKRAKALILQLQLVESFALLRVGKDSIGTRREITLEIPFELAQTLHTLLLVDISSHLGHSLVVAIPVFPIAPIQLIELIIVQIQLLTDDTWVKPRLLA